MYLDYFSLKRHPFRITPDPSLFFAGGTRGRGVVLDALVYGITSGEGILKVVGEVGSGKTMLCRMLEERLPDSIEIVYLANPSLSARDIVYAIAIELKLDVDAATDRLLVMHKLQEYLLRKHAEGGSVVVFIEEAQSMPLETLEEVRLLSNLETHRHKLMQIVLFGQPELDRKLEQRDIRQLRERITHSFNLAPLTTGEIREYLHFRLRVAGCPWPQLFSPKAEIMLAKASGGLSRRINMLADKALLAAYADPATRPDARNSAGEILPVVYPRHIRTAIADSSYSRLQPLQLLRWASYLAAALGGAFVVGLTLWVFSPAQPTFPDVSSPVVLSQEAGAVQRQPEVAPVPVVEAVATTAPVEIAAAVATAVGATVQDVQMPDQVVQDEVAEPEMAQQGMAQLDVARQEIAQQQEVAQPEVAQVAEEQDPVAPALAAAPASGSPGPAPGSESAAVPDGLSGLIRSRFIASSPWLATMSQKTGYSVQLYSEATDNVTKLEEFLDFLELYDMLDASYLCLISGNSRRREQWLVLHGEFAGLSEAREFIDDLPPYIGQHGPYARNMEGIACANDRR
jgi:type II secretory pathway predicted ATPase ExeA